MLAKDFLYTHNCIHIKWLVSLTLLFHIRIVFFFSRSFGVGCEVWWCGNTFTGIPSDNLSCMCGNSSISNSGDVILTNRRTMEKPKSFVVSHIHTYIYHALFQFFSSLLAYIAIASQSFIVLFGRIHSSRKYIKLFSLINLYVCRSHSMLCVCVLAWCAWILRWGKTMARERAFSFSSGN